MRPPSPLLSRHPHCNTELVRRGLVCVGVRGGGHGHTVLLGTQYQVGQETSGRGECGQGRGGVRAGSCAHLCATRLRPARPPRRAAAWRSAAPPPRGGAGLGWSSCRCTAASLGGTIGRVCVWGGGGGAGGGSRRSLLPSVHTRKTPGTPTPRMHTRTHPPTHTHRRTRAPASVSSAESSWASIAGRSMDAPMNTISWRLHACMDGCMGGGVAWASGAVLHAHGASAGRGGGAFRQRGGSARRLGATECTACARTCRRTRPPGQSQRG